MQELHKCGYCRYKVVFRIISRSGAAGSSLGSYPKVIRSSRISATIVGVAALFLPSMRRMGIKGEYGKMADVVYAPD